MEVSATCGEAEPSYLARMPMRIPEHISFSYTSTPPGLPVVCFSNCYTLVSGLWLTPAARGGGSGEGVRGTHVGWLQLPEVWQSVNKETKAVNHWLRQFLLGSFKACHGFLFLHMGKRPVLPQTQT